MSHTITPTAVTSVTSLGIPTLTTGMPRVPVEQAAQNALALWLTAAMPDVVVRKQWPEHGVKLGPKVITIVRTGQSTEDKFDPQVTDVVDTAGGTIFTWGLSFIEQPLELDVWTTSEALRGDIVARLRDAINAGSKPLVGSLPVSLAIDPTDNGLIVPLSDGFNGTASIDFEQPTLSDSGEGLKTTEYRAMYAGTATMCLSVRRISSRITVMTLEQTLVADITAPEPSTPSDTATITAVGVTFTG